MNKFVYNETVIKQHINEMFECIEHKDREKHKHWYVETNKWCKDFAKEHQLKPMPVMGVTAALSPMCSWKQNKLFVEAYYNGIEKHFKAQIAKANRIDRNYSYLGIRDYHINKKQIMSFLGGRKTQSFFENILEPKRSKKVCIDRHMLTISGISSNTLTEKQYNFLEVIYQDLSKENGLIPNQFQSILWGYYRQSNDLNWKYG